MARFQEMIYCMKPDDKKARFDTPLSGNIEIGVDEENDEKGQVVHIPLVFKPEALEEAIQEYTTEIEGALSNMVFRSSAPEALALRMVQAGGEIFLGHANDVVT